MGDPGSPEQTQTGKPVKAQIERELVGEISRIPELAAAFTRIFNRDGDAFSRIFSRGGAVLDKLKPQELTTMDEADFAKFKERLGALQDMASEAPER